MLPIAEPLAARARRAAALIQQHREKRWTVVHHIDADGVSSGGIAMESLHRAGIQAEPLAVKSLDDRHIQLIHDASPEAIWFCDLGSTAYMEFPDVPKVVCDHHELIRDGAEEFDGHVNPLLDDSPGHDVSGAGTAFLVSTAMDEANLDLLPMALVGAAADLQDRQEGAFIGTNRALVAAGAGAGLVHEQEDLGFYGPETRPLRKFLGLASEHAVPGAVGDARAAEPWLRSLGIELLREGQPRTWADLEEEEKTRIRSALVGRALECGIPSDEIDAMFRTVIRLPQEPHPQTRELQEFGTLLNATARYDRPDIGLAVARGDRGAAFETALELRDGHRAHLVDALTAVQESGIQQQGCLQVVHVRDAVRDTVIGIVCGMALDSTPGNGPLIGLAFSGPDKTKVSGRAPAELQRQGIDLATAMRAAAAAVSGQGGGHKGAAGATIPRAEEATFLETLEREIGSQLEGNS